MLADVRHGVASGQSYREPRDEVTRRVVGYGTGVFKTLVALRSLLCAIVLAGLVSCGNSGPTENPEQRGPFVRRIRITNNSEFYFDEFIFREPGTGDAGWRFISTGLPWTGFPDMLTCSIGSAIPPDVEQYPFPEGILLGAEMTVDIMGYARCRPPNCGSVDPSRCHTQTRTFSNVDLHPDQDTLLTIN